MAVKHGCRDSGDESKLNNLKRVLETIEQQKQCSRYLDCAKIVTYLGQTAIPSDPTQYKIFMEYMRKVRDVLQSTIISQEMIVATLHTFYNEISNPDRQPTPTMSIVLFLIERQQIPKAVEVILKHGHQEVRLEQALHTLCGWLARWTQTPNLGPLVSELMRGLEHEQHYDILVNVTLTHIDSLFKLLILKDTREGIGPVVLHMLGCMQQRPRGFAKILPQVPQVLEELERENTKESVGFQQKLINVCLALLDRFSEFKGDEQLMYSLKKHHKSFYTSAFYKTWPDNANAVTQSECMPGRVGLTNLGNTCYMNSVLQALFMTKSFRNDVLLYQLDAMPIFAKLQLLFALLQFSQRGSLSPTDIAHLARPPGFQPGHQHDSSEFLGYLLDILHEQEASLCARKVGFDAGPSSPGLPTVVKLSFGGKSLTLSTCHRCGGRSERIDTFRDLQLSFPCRSENQSVQTLLDFYLQTEKLMGDNQYHCDCCRGLTDGERVTQIIEPPQCLILTLKHFRYDPATQLRTKILQRVQLDDSITLAHHQYALYAAVVHCGSSVDSGHYYTYAKEGDDWYKFNDCFVGKSSAAELCGLRPPEAPYILFYRRADCSEPETCSKLQLSQKLLAALIRDEAAFEAERRKPQPDLGFDSAGDGRHRDDDPPPPGCGGGGGGGAFFGASQGRFVC